MTLPKVRSIADKLKRIAGERNALYAEVLTQFLIERALARLISEPFLFEKLIFKGGYVGIRVYDSPRFTTDLDAVTDIRHQQQVLEKAREVMAIDLGDHVWFAFEKQMTLQTQSDYGGIRLQYRGGLGDPLTKLIRAQIIHLDIGTGDPITPPPRVERTLATLGDSELSWQVYPMETIIAEKLHPFIALGQDNSRAKDVFDLAFYLPKANPELLTAAIGKTFSYRRSLPPVSFSKVISEMDLANIRRGWRAAVVSVKPVPDFDATITEVLNWLRVHRL